MGSVLSLVVYAHELKRDKKGFPYQIFEPREPKEHKANSISIERCSTKSPLLRK